MKNLLTVLNIFVAGIACVILLPACQKQELGANHMRTSDDPIVTRGGECDTCDTYDCCCFVELDDDDAAILHLCGTADGASACQGSQGNCNQAQNGGGQFITLSSGSNPKQIFCMDEMSTVRIINWSSTDNAGIRVGCNTVSTRPIEYVISPQDSVKANTDGSCVLTDCSS